MGVCEGIAKSVKLLCDALGVWCVIAICGNNPEKGIKYRHTWNIVRIGGQYYHLDATFDNTLGKHQGNAEAPGEIRYDYFNLGDKAVFRDHEPLIAPAPGCPDNDHFYYKEKKLSFTKTEEVYKRAQQMAKKGRAMTFQWRGGYLTREVLQELLELIRKAGEERQKTAGSVSTGHRRSFISAMWKMQASRSRRSSWKTPTKENSSTPGNKGMG